MNKKEIKSFSPPNLGWLEYKLNSKEMDYVWRCIDNKKNNCNSMLVGNITSSHTLMDRGDWFYINVISPLMETYADEFENLGKKVATSVYHPYHMNNWWVNYQKQTEFNPNHDHNGIYSFVIWMKIPFNYEEQVKKNIPRRSDSGQVSCFEFNYSNLMGDCKTFSYQLSSKDDGRMIFFPSKLNHQVYPFYDCDEDRISVSGNIMLDTSKRR